MSASASEPVPPTGQPAASGTAATSVIAAGPGARIEATAWTYCYPGRGEPAVRDASFVVEPGQLVVLLGASGSGKSTLLAGLAGVLPEGSIQGHLVVESHRASPPRAPQGLVAQDPQSNVVMELVGDDLAFPLENLAVEPPELWDRVHQARAAVGLEPGVDQSTARLSGGQLQLLAVAAATIGAPGLLLLDEPTANLDAEAAAAVVRTVLSERARTGCTVVVVEHRVRPWLERADLVLVADAGTVTSVTVEDLEEHLAGRPGLADRVWLDDTHLPRRPPSAPAGAVALTATGVALPGRLVATDLVCRSGEIVALTGSPGSGKSTLLACLAGLLRPDSGRVELAAGRRDPWDWPAGSVPGTFGVVFQNPEHQFLTGSVRAELEHGQDLQALGVEARVDALLARLHLEALAAVDPFTLSGGEQRRLSVGTALVAQPDVLVLDEPTFGQDPTTWRELVAIIAEHRDAGGAVILATHDPVLVAALEAREVRLSAGVAGAGRGAAAPTEPPTSSVADSGGSGLDASSAATSGASVPGPAASDAPAPDPTAADVPALRQGHSTIDALTRGAFDTSGSRGLRSLDSLALLTTAALLTAAALLSNSVPFNVSLAAAALAAGLLGGLSVRWVALLAIPAMLATFSVALSNALLGEHGLLAWQSWQAAALPATRILAVAVPGLIAAAAMDPTGLADSLVVRLRVGPRVAYSVLAGLRLIPLLAEEWEVLARASRARGLGGRGLVGRARLFASMAFRLLVSALRRGGRLAVALDVRGLTGSRDRTIARPVRWRARDSLAVLGGVAVLALGLLTR